MGDFELGARLLTYGGISSTFGGVIINNIFISDQSFANHRPRSFSIDIAKFAIPFHIIFFAFVIVNQFFFLQSSIPDHFCEGCANLHDRKRYHFLADLHIAVMNLFHIVVPDHPFKVSSERRVNMEANMFISIFNIHTYYLARCA